MKTRTMMSEVFSARRPRFGCFCWTFSPSRRQIRWTRLALTAKPAWRRGRRNALEVVAASGPGQFDDVGGQHRLVIAPSSRLALGGPMLAQGHESPPFRDLQFRSDLVHAGPATSWA